MNLPKGYYGRPIRSDKSFAEVRRFYTTEWEEQQAMKEGNIEPSPDHKEMFYRSQKAIYIRRWQKVNEAFIELDSISLEAQSIWGQSVIEILDGLRLCSGTLNTTIGAFLFRLKKSLPNIDKDKAAEERKIMFGNPLEKENFFTEEINEAVRRIEIFLKPYLKI